MDCGAERGDLHEAVAAYVNVGKAESPSDQVAAPEKALDLLGTRVGGDIEVLRLFAEEDIADAAADQARLESVPPEPVHDVQHAFIDKVEGHGMPVRPYDNRVFFPERDDHSAASVHDWYFPDIFTTL